jgi:hypothetical protein
MLHSHFSSHGCSCPFLDALPRKLPATHRSIPFISAATSRKPTTLPLPSLPFGLARKRSPIQLSCGEANSSLLSFLSALPRSGCCSSRVLPFAYVLSQAVSARSHFLPQPALKSSPVAKKHQRRSRTFCMYLSPRLRRDLFLASTRPPGWWARGCLWRSYIRIAGPSSNSTFSSLLLPSYVFMNAGSSIGLSLTCPLPRPSPDRQNAAFGRRHGCSLR